MAKGGFRGGFGMGGNMGAIMQQAQKMQRDIEVAKAEIDALEVDATAGGGVVKIVISGTHEIKSLTIDPSAVDPEDVEMLQDLIIAAYNEASRKLAEISAEKMSKATGGAKLPF
ncbi:MAG: YbaB/EbfC family nucleoid-associated protein [Clostridiales bacterium]|nr:YbaB/EbfC family nucleoid-associated protein [Clostridiales bacterium]MBR4797741.1 YbaB/EbfC family nucleoid-associated protein [Oscillospiraceae bacterium]MBR5974966.1 YbaB/EbfC family nucleoid-associated protein [Clostridiales bacterium]